MTEGIKRRKLNFEKCEYCRKDKQKCTPTTRVWSDQKCDRCSKQGLPCGPNSLPGRLKHRKQDRMSESELSASCDLPIAMLSHGTQQQERSERLDPEQPILRRYSSESDFLLQTLEGAMLYNHPKIVKSVIQDHLINIDSTLLQGYIVELIDWDIWNHGNGTIESLILHCPQSAFQYALKQRGGGMLDWANYYTDRQHIFRALLHWEIVYGRENSHIVLLEAVKKRYSWVGVEVAKLLLQFSGIKLKSTDVHRQGKEGHTSFSMSNDGSLLDDGDDHEPGHSRQFNDLRMKVIELGDHTKLPLPPMTISAGYLLHVAIRSGQLEAVKELLCSPESDVMSQNNTTLNYRDSDDDTPLIAAITRQDGLDIVSLLLDRRGIDVNAQNVLCEDVLNLAIEQEDRDVVRSLLRHPEIDSNSRDLEDKTPIIFAASLSNVEIIKDLLHHSGIDINAQDWYGKTALHYAMEAWQKSPGGWLDDKARVVILLLRDSRTRRLPDEDGNLPDVFRFMEEHYKDRDIPENLSRWRI